MHLPDPFASPGDDLAKMTRARKDRDFSRGKYRGYLGQKSTDGKVHFGGERQHPKAAFESGTADSGADPFKICSIDNESYSVRFRRS